VLVVNYNTRVLLEACLASVRRERPAAVVVVDNGSTDGSLEMVARDFPEATLLALGRNAGYGAAANAGVAACAGPYVVVLNSDTVVEPGALAALASHLEANAGAAVAGPRLTNADGSPQASCFPFPGTLGWLLENDPMAPALAMLPAARRRMLRYTLPTQAAPVPWVLGAALALRRAPFEAAGGFDEDFFMYFEEVDLGRRLADAGWEVHYVPEAVVRHVGAASTSKQWRQMTLAHAASMRRYYRKHCSGARLHTWRTLMGTKMLALCVRDLAASMTTSDRGRRQALAERAGVWWDAFSWARTNGRTGTAR